VFLVGLVLGTWPSRVENKVPDVCFWLVALAPLLLAPFLVPRIARRNRWVLLALRVVLVLAPLVVAVLLAGQNEKFPYEEEPEWSRRATLPINYGHRITPSTVPPHVHAQRVC
jgi:hypothetical protein